MVQPKPDEQVLKDNQTFFFGFQVYYYMYCHCVIFFQMTIVSGIFTRRNTYQCVSMREATIYLWWSRRLTWWFAGRHQTIYWLPWQNRWCGLQEIHLHLSKVSADNSYSIVLVIYCKLRRLWLWTTFEYLCDCLSTQNF